MTTTKRMDMNLLQSAAIRSRADIVLGPFRRKGTAVGGIPRLADYAEYDMSMSQVLLSALVGAGAMGFVAWTFFQSPLALFLLGAGGLYAPLLRHRQLIRGRQAQLKLQFKQMLAALSSSLGAGRSVESAFAEALQDLGLLYPDPDTMIVREVRMILRRLENGETIESSLLNFSARAHIDEISQFAEVFVTCKRTGGNLVQVIRRTALVIQDKLDIEQEIGVMLAQKRFESRVLSAAPVLFIAFLVWTTPDYMEPLYHGGGVVIMVGALLVLFACYLITQKIMNIKV
ncbi:Flp pilus assembly protein TadB-like protein [Paenibacillus mucilaginosus 3016]|uniref:Flp pilus assembly protein TadB-like protein n=1 Tax=Paenibacillus mucilaginosus 3016 TaxID=1116391 RepID=H6NFF7_9BACL|nr:type II secretion system F family protein [Paenibacillus mucilaginosus]AFC30043.1 Flp pilus assembly protein TadB-like protein [Paenibacillus mucilaginosus 3016]WFA18698.1 pilus assembly protein TadB [Paenibacillus mucilaginosus]